MGWRALVVLGLVVCFLLTAGAAAAGRTQLQLISSPVALSSPARIAVVNAAPSPDAALGGQWTLQGTQPPGRSNPRFVYDSRADAFLLFGGGTGGSDLTNSTWMYSPSANTWTNVTPAVGPSPRAAFGLAYDVRADRFVLFGGLVGLTGRANDTWVFDLTNRTWTNVTRGSGPDARTGPSMVYDSAIDRMILFGGYNGTDCYDTWSYDLANTTWTKLNTVGPGSRYLASMVYDSVADRVILFGGYYAGSAVQSFVLNDTWSFIASTASWVGGVDTNAPSPRFGAAMAYDSQDQKTILFGGSGDVYGTSLLNDTWIWEAPQGHWIRLLAAAGPAKRVHAAMDYDPVNGRVLLFGGSLGVPGVSDELWSYQYAPTLPSAPTFSFPIPLDNEIFYVWDPPTYDGGAPVLTYHVYRGLTPGGEVFYGNAGNAYVWDDFNVTNGKQYYYRVTAVNAAGEGPRSPEVVGTPVGPPGPPLNLTAFAGKAQITLTWKPPTITGGYTTFSYQILRGPASNAETNFTTLGNVTAWIDTNVTAGTTYYYMVKAINPTAEGPASNEVSAKPVPLNAPDAPGSPTATGKRGEIDLAWFAASVPSGAPPVTAYKVYRGTTSGGETFVTTLGNVLTYADLNVVPGTRYYYEVTALNSVGEGVRSAEASAIPLETTPPNVTITSPANSANLTSAKVTVQGTASDDVAVAKVELSTDGVNWTLASGTTSWSGNVTLVDGHANAIYARATDTAGNVRVVGIVVFVNLPKPPPQGPDLLFVGGLSLVVVALIVGAVLVLWGERRRKAQRPPPEPPHEPSE